MRQNKRTIALLLVLFFLSVCLSGCGGDNGESSLDYIKKLVNRSEEKDIIKFDDIEWLTEQKEVEEKIKDIITNKNAKKETEKSRIEKDEYDTYITGINRIEFGGRKGEEESIGSIAGWDIEGIVLDYITKKDGKKKYLYGCIIYINTKNKDSNIILEDIQSKLNDKYKDIQIREGGNKEDNYYNCEWSDNNDNRISLLMNKSEWKYESEENYHIDTDIEIRYYCGDVLNYLNDSIKESTKLDQNKDYSGL